MTYSPDGRYWWNGYQWTPVPGKTLRDRIVESPWWAWTAGFVLVSCLLTAGSVYEFTLAGTFPVFGAADPPGPCAPAPCANVSGRGWRDLPLSGYGWTVKVSNVQYDPDTARAFPAPAPWDVYVMLDVRFTNQTQWRQVADPHDFILEDGAGFSSDVIYVLRNGAGAAPLPSSAAKAVEVAPGAQFGPETLVFRAQAELPRHLLLYWRPGRFYAPYYRIPLT